MNPIGGRRHDPGITSWTVFKGQESINLTVPIFKTYPKVQTDTITNNLSSKYIISFHDIREELQTITLVLLFLFSVVSNGIVFLLFYKKPLLRTFSNRFVLNLSLTHLLQTLLIMPGFLLAGIFGVWTLGDTWCHISGIVSTCLNLETSFSLVLIAVDRNYAVNSPLHYSMTITKRKTGVLIIFTWILAFLMSTPLIFGIPKIRFRINWNACVPVWFQRDSYTFVYSGLIVMAGLVMPLVKLSWTYCSMFLAARTSSARARKHSVNTPTVAEVQFLDSQGSCTVHQLKKKPYRRMSSSSQFFFFGDEWKAVRTGVIVLFSFIFCWGPYFVVIGAEPYMQIENWIPEFIPLATVLLSFSACVINPYIYVFRNKTTRKHAKRLLHCARPETENCLSTVKQEKNEVHSNVVPHLRPLGNEEDLEEIPQEVTRKNSIQNIADFETQSIDQPLCSASESNTRSVNPFTSQNDGTLQCEPYHNNGFYNYVPIPPSPERFIVFQLHCYHRDSTSSDTTDNVGTSVDSVDDNLSLYGTMFSKQKNSRESTATFLHMNEIDIPVKPRARPPLLRAHSFEQDEQDPTNPIQGTSKFYKGGRRKPILQHRYLLQQSSDSTLTSSLSTDSQESSNVTDIKPRCRGRPLLVRQQSSNFLSYYKPLECQTKTETLSREDSVCYSICDEKQ
ncbi:G protein-coupled receptor 161-like [Limulus polyphemus]|uniref:G protein-coupled receptor 161-like n=1 Tax=Limulus polyphemus TaxID=6850 RepID=A0ABM1RXQ3_LIMPO|nr:G protein-coupled receptor 161-like [Limulus polyphemus]